MSLLPTYAANAQPAKKTTMEGTSIVMHDDVWSRIVPYDDSETLAALVCAGKTTCDAAVFRDVTDGSLSLVPTIERHFVEFAKNDS